MLRDTRRRKAYDAKRSDGASLRIQLAEARQAHTTQQKSERRGATPQGRQYHAKAEADLKAFCKAHYDPAIGARGLPGFIQANIEPIIVNMILDSDKRGKLELAYNPKRAVFEIRAA